MTPCHVKITGSIHVSFKLGKYELRPEVKKLYQLRPEVTASSVSVATRVVNPKHDELRPVVSKELYQLCPSFSASCILLVSRVVNSARMSCIERYGYSKCPTILRFLHGFIVHYCYRPCLPVQRRN